MRNGFSTKPFPNQTHVFMCPQSKPFENTVEKGAICPFPTVVSIRLKNFPPGFSSNLKLFLPFWSTVCHFNQI